MLLTDGGGDGRTGLSCPDVACLITLYHLTAFVVTSL